MLKKNKIKPTQEFTFKLQLKSNKLEIYLSFVCSSCSNKKSGSRKQQQKINNKNICIKLEKKKIVFSKKKAKKTHNEKQQGRYSQLVVKKKSSRNMKKIASFCIMKYKICTCVEKVGTIFYQPRVMYVDVG